MYAQLVLFALGPDTRPTAEKIADQFVSAYTTQKGFKSVTFLADSETGEYGALSLWESKEDVEAWMVLAGPELENTLEGLVKDPPVRRIFEVYEPQG